MLPTDAQMRKAIPIYSGFVKYFPHAMAAVAELSRIGNDQHNPGQPLHWAKEKSQDELDALMRHTVDFAIDADHRDPDGVHPAVKRAWRAMADLERLHDAGVDIFAVPMQGIEFEDFPAPALAPFMKSISCEGDKDSAIGEPHAPTQEEIRDMERGSEPLDAALPEHHGPWDVVFTDDKGYGLEGETRRGPYETVEQAKDYAQRNPEQLAGTKSIQPSKCKVRNANA